MATNTTERPHFDLDRTDAEIRIGLEQEPRVQVCEILQRVLADEITLYTKTRNYHWNVMGPRFHTLHIFLEQQYQALQEKSDEVAERIRSLVEYAAGSMAEFLTLTGLQEQPGDVHPTANQMLATLTSDHEAIIRRLRKDVDLCDNEHGDAGTADFLTGLMEDHEKLAWMLRSHLATDAD
ncbi:MAG TPA: DNA starvation/stationary phase protection protein [Chthoniobacterales bacterium]